MSLRHRASSASLYQQISPNEKQQRGSYMKPFRRIDPGTNKIYTFVCK